MSDPAKREWQFYVDDMIAFAGKVLTYTEALDQAGFSERTCLRRYAAQP